MADVPDPQTVTSSGLTPTDITHGPTSPEGTDTYYTTVGVVVGRFQVDDLHPGHRSLLDYVSKTHARMIVLVGCRPARSNKNNPLSFEARRLMIQSLYPLATILPIVDTRKDTTWSRSVDYAIRIVSGASECVMYSGRDGFQDSYTGHHEVQIMNFTADSEGWAGTKQRKKVAAANLASRDFRVGIIHGVTREGTKVENAVDMAVLNPDRSKIILGRKPGEDLLRFPGGMFDAGDDPHFEATASREIREETGVTVAHAEWKYICNRNVDDWRCRDSDEHFYHTTFFMAVLPWAAQTKADDDLEDADWHEISDIMPSMLVEEHRHLWDALEEYLNNNYPREEK